MVREGKQVRSNDPRQGPERMTTLRRRASLLVAMGEFIDGYDLLVMGTAIIYLPPQFHLGPEAVGLLGGAAFFGSASPARCPASISSTGSDSASSLISPAWPAACWRWASPSSPPPVRCCWSSHSCFYAFIEWWATFHRTEEEPQRWTDYFEKEGFAKWLASPRATMTADPH
jgi:hypothetical protein